MKLKDGLVLREVAGQYVIVPVGKRVREVRNMVYLSSSAAFLWENVKDREFTVPELVELILNFYTGVTPEAARADIEKFLEILKRNQILEPEPGSPEAGSGFVRLSLRNDTK